MKKYLGFIATGITLIMSVISYFILPETVVIRIGLDAQPTAYGSKFMVFAIAFVIALIGGFVQYNDKDERSYRGLVLSIVGIAVVAMLLWINM